MQRGLLRPVFAGAGPHGSGPGRAHGYPQGQISLHSGLWINKVGVSGTGQRQSSEEGRSGPRGRGQDWRWLPDPPA